MMSSRRCASRRHWTRWGFMGPVVFWDGLLGDSQGGPSSSLGDLWSGLEFLCLGLFWVLVWQGIAGWKLRLGIGAARGEAADGIDIGKDRPRGVAG
ncbi:hypothetical protein BP00DRAFT_117687 [Aspergillus indologenus CBS 114.80]|uniref:Uncharacterized protein n=1 Tax=Aspergillus indologenus CBS 114.80 TaxID=1450541 RepID=A0A2V5I9T0_9EURO|nr:hypothetical protein BP00DRAFT_117687 [Aspergillus indologenus CBS 114.80]